MAYQQWGQNGLTVEGQDTQGYPADSHPPIAPIGLPRGAQIPWIGR